MRGTRLAILSAMALISQTITLLAAPNVQNFTFGGENVRVVTLLITMEESRTCTDEERSALDARAREISVRHLQKHISNRRAETKIKGFGLKEKNTFFLFEHGVVCFESGLVAIRYPVRGKTIELHSRKKDQEWMIREK